MKKKTSNQGRIPATRSPKTAWFEEARFGMYIHWGLYSIPGGIWKGSKMKHPYSEWLQASEHIPRAEYRKLAAAFNPGNFDADAWVQEAANAGMKYLMVTTKHHDGFALWPSRASKFNIRDATPFKGDILADITAACRRHGIGLGFYYSHWQDWEGVGGDICTVHMENKEYVHPTQKEFESYWQNKCLKQVTELIENYDPDLFWFDSWDDYEGKGRDLTSSYLTLERQSELISLIRRLSPRCLVNSRICFESPSPEVDYMSTADNDFPTKGFDKPWETPGTLNDSWAYHALDFRWKSARQLLQNLIHNASLGGNYELNVGPMPDGRFQPAAIRRLREIGAWLHVHGESIYGTQASQLPTPPWGRMTLRRLKDGKARIYLHLFEFTPGAALFIDGLGASMVSASVMETGQLLRAEARGDGVWVVVPEELRGSDLPVIALEVNGKSNLDAKSKPARA